jgi:hypothetical protein
MRPRLPRWQRPVFLVNRRLGLVTAAPSRSRRKGVHATRGAPSPEVTGPICRVPWRGFPRPPRSARPAHLCRFAVRARAPWLGAFLGGPASIPTVRPRGPPLRSPLGRRRGGFACRGSLPAWRPRGPGPSPPRPPVAQLTGARGTGMLTRCPSPAAPALGLGPPHPQLISMAAEPSGIRCGGFPPPSRYSCRHSRSPPLHPWLAPGLLGNGDAPLPLPPRGNPRLRSRA